MPAPRDLREQVVRAHCATAADPLVPEAFASLVEELHRLRAAVGGDKPKPDGIARCPECGEILGGEVGARGLTDATIDCGPEHVVTYPDAVLVGSGSAWATHDTLDGPPC